MIYLENSDIKKVAIIYACYEPREYFEMHLADSVEYAKSKGYEISIYRMEGPYLGFGKSNDWDMPEKEKKLAKYNLVGGLRNKGISEAVKDGNDFLIVTDDDVILERDTIYKFIDYYKLFKYKMASCVTVRQQDNNTTNCYKQVIHGLTPFFAKTLPKGCFYASFADEIYAFPRETLYIIGESPFYVPDKFEELGIPPIESQEIHGIWKNCFTHHIPFFIIDVQVPLYNPHIK